MNQWLFSVTKVTAQEIQEYCVQDETWQKYRVRMLGMPTAKKLDELSVWRDMGLLFMPNTTEFRRKEVQIANYLNALKRGGLLDHQLRVIK